MALLRELWDTIRGRNAKAKEDARSAGDWRLLAELHEADGEIAEAAVAYERAGMVNTAAGSYERAGMAGEAAHCYLRAEMHEKAVELLMAKAGDVSADHLETAVRAVLRQQNAGTGSPDPRLAAAVRRCAQLWLEQGDAERAYQVAAAGEEWQAAVPARADDPSRPAARPPAISSDVVVSDDVDKEDRAIVASEYDSITRVDPCFLVVLVRPDRFDPKPGR